MTPIRAELHRSLPRLSERARPTAVAAAVATALGVLLAPAAMAQVASQQRRPEPEAQQVQKLQQQIDKLEQQQASQPVPAPVVGSRSLRNNVPEAGQDGAVVLRRSHEGSTSSAASSS